MGTKAGLVAAAVVVVALAALRIGDEPPWKDEQFTLALVHQPTAGVTEAVFTHEANMGPYYLAAEAWAVIDESPEWVRTLSVLGGLASVAALAALARRWIGGTMATAAPLLLALHPFFLDYLTEARAYSWAMAAVLIASTAIDRQRIHPLRYGVAMGLACALNAVSVLFIAAHATGLLVLRVPRPMWRQLATGVAISAVVFAPFARVLVAQHGEQAAWIPSLSFTQVATALRDLAGSNLLAVVTGCVLLAYLVSVLRAQRLDLAPVMILCCTVVPIGGLALLSLVTPLFVHRFLIGVVPFFILAAIDLIGRARRPWLAAGVAGLVLVVGGWRIDQDRPRDDLEPRVEATGPSPRQEGLTASTAVESAQR